MVQSLQVFLEALIKKEVNMTATQTTFTDLSPEQASESYDRDGYLIVRGLWSPLDVQDARGRASSTTSPPRPSLRLGSDPDLLAPPRATRLGTMSCTRTASTPRQTDDARQPGASRCSPPSSAARRLPPRAGYQAARASCAASDTLPAVMLATCVAAHIDASHPENGGFTSPHRARWISTPRDRRRKRGQYSTSSARPKE